MHININNTSRPIKATPSLYLSWLSHISPLFFLLKQKSCCSDGGGDFINVNHSAGLSTTKCLHHLAVIYPKALMGKSLLKSPFGGRRRKKKTKQNSISSPGSSLSLSLSLYLDCINTQTGEDQSTWTRFLIHHFST